MDLPSDERVNVLRGLLETMLGVLVSVGHVELCHSMANFLTFVTQWHPQTSQTAGRLESTMSLSSAIVTYTAC